MALALSAVGFSTVTVGSASYVMDGPIDMTSYQITNLAAPTATNDAARLADTQGITIPILNSTGATVNVSLSK